MTGKEIEIAGIPAIVLRVSYTGELGWELYHPIDSMGHLCSSIWSAGEQHGIGWFGTYAVNSMRLEKGYKAWGSELTTEITPVEADIERFVDGSKEFIGKQATEQRKKDGISTKLVLAQIDANDADCLGNEPALDGDRVMGVVCSGAYGHRTGMSLAYVYVEPEFSSPGDTFHIPVLGSRRSATVLKEPPYDPQNERLRA